MVQDNPINWDFPTKKEKKEKKIKTWINGYETCIYKSQTQIKSFDTPNVQTRYFELNFKKISRSIFSSLTVHQTQNSRYFDMNPLAVFWNLNILNILRMEEKSFFFFFFYCIYNENSIFAYAPKWSVNIFLRLFLFSAEQKGFREIFYISKVMNILLLQLK